MASVKSSKNAWTLLLLILAGIVLGGFLGSLAADVPFLDWLNYGQTFGFDSPVILNLGILVVTFGMTVRITIAGIIGIMSAVLVYRYL